MTHSGHTNSANVGHGFCLLVSSQEVTFECLLAKIHLGDMVVCVVLFVFVLVFGWCLEDVLLSQLPGELDALPSGKQLRMLGDPA